ncbi:MAG: hypothetical protein JO142_10715 [Burkholderiales bacterium]|nr:hypothetical protein [Burkholderiales bacterium]
MKIKIPGLKPRNPVALAARQRNAGVHEKTEKTKRRDARQALKRELKGGREDFSALSHILSHQCRPYRVPHVI